MEKYPGYEVGTIGWNSKPNMAKINRQCQFLSIVFVCTVSTKLVSEEFAETSNFRFCHFSCFHSFIY